jgi:hypothetical protein
LVGIPDGIDPHAICCLPASIRHSFASKLYRDERWRLQVACCCSLSQYKDAFAVIGSSSWLIDVTDGYVVFIGAYLAFNHPCYASSGSLIHSNIHRGTM